jgi:hypothetical protein
VGLQVDIAEVNTVVIVEIIDTADSRLSRGDMISYTGGDFTMATQRKY